MPTSRIATGAAGDPLVLRFLTLWLLAVLLFLPDRDPVSRIGWGEMITLPWALQLVNPEWLPSSWLFNSPPGSQLLTFLLSGPLVELFGFFWASVLGRLLLYAFLAYSLSTLTRRLGIPASFVMAALLGFAAMNQSLGAGEWVFRDLEAKSFAYGFVLLGLSSWVKARPCRAAACFGVATSFHFLVGTWSTAAWLLALLGDRPDRRVLIRMSGCYVLTALLGIFNVAYEIVSSWGSPPVSQIIARFRVAHHVVPAYFAPSWALRLLLFLAVWALLWRRAGLPPTARKVARFALATAAFFGAALLVEPFDRHGLLLQLYPFRVGDTLFPLLTLLLSYFAVERWSSPRVRARALSVIAAAVLVLAVVSFGRAATRLAKPAAEAASWVEMCEWISRNTPADAIVVVPPGTQNFAVLAGRATVAAFRQFPFHRPDVAEWHRRIGDLAGGDLRLSASGLAAIPELDERYGRLSGDQVRELMQRYGAEFFLTSCDHRLEMPRAHARGRFCLHEPARDSGTLPPRNAEGRPSS